MSNPVYITDTDPLRLPRYEGVANGLPPYVQPVPGNGVQGMGNGYQGNNMYQGNNGYQGNNAYQGNIPYHGLGNSTESNIRRDLIRNVYNNLLVGRGDVQGPGDMIWMRSPRDSDDNQEEESEPRSVVHVYNNLIVGKADIHGPGDMLWMRSRPAPARNNDDDDPCDDGTEGDPMDEMERDYDDDDDDDDESRYSCCAEMHYNCARFHEVLEEEAYLLKRSYRKLDVKQKMKSIFTMKRLKSFFPILEWAPKYRTRELQGDIIAGITVGLTLIPQSIAYAKIANLPAEYGLYSSIIGCFVYVIFGTSKDAACGPTAIQSLLTYSYGRPIVPNDPTAAILLGFFTGIIQIIMFIVGFGKLIDLISLPVLKAFTVACSITIAMTQVKKWWGLHDVPNDFIPQLRITLQKIPETRLYDFLMGVVCITVIVTLKKLKEKHWKRKLRDLPWRLKIVKKGIWFLGTGKNIVVLVFSSIVAFIFMHHGYRPFSLTGEIKPGIPAFRAPNFSYYNPETNLTLTLTDMMENMGVGIIVTPILGIIETMTIVKVFARKFEYKPDFNQDLLPFGIANIFGSFIQGYPVAASFPRTAVNAGSGVRTPAGGIISGSIILIALQFLTPIFYYIPEATLGVVIIMAVIDPITFHKVWIFWKTKKIDLFPWFATFILCFAISIQWGVLIGTGLSLIMLLYPIARPSIRISELREGVEVENMKVILVTIDTGLMYPAVEYIKKKIRGYCSKVIGARYVLLDFSHVAVIDTTTVQGVRELLIDFNKDGITVYICGLQKPVATIFRKALPNFLNQAATVKQALDITNDNFTFNQQARGSRAS